MPEPVRPLAVNSQAKAARLDWSSLFLHLRLHHQLLFLSPLFAWGTVLGGGVLSSRTLLAFVGFHVFLYGGITAYNSYYDRDEGPVGGMRSPPPVRPELLGFSLGVQAVGLLLVSFAGLDVALLYAFGMLLSVAYSHPKVRWKARPVLSLVVVALGQGAAGFAAGWMTGNDPALPLLGSPSGSLGLAAATLVTAGFYPLTQLYQIDEDRARGDLTFTVVFGPKASFALALSCVGFGSACLVASLAVLFGPRHAIAVATVSCLFLTLIASWRLRFVHSVEENFVKLHWLQTGFSLATLGYVGLLLFES